MKQNVLFYVQQHRQQKNLPLGGFSEKYISLIFRGGFSLTKKQIEKQVFNLEFALFAHRVLGKIACGNRAKLLFNSQKRAFTDKVFRTLRSATKDAVFGICHLLKKVDENFCFCACY